ncbi:MAG: hypothetical protein JWQ35_386 [Bacteriovoracaceae bacterium]|nr:hypothetical protein [Bacteriovoracaceae bacterium]
MTTPQNLRIYFWVPRSEVVFIQAVIDAYEGLARIRTERHQVDRSLIMCLVQESRVTEFHDVMRNLTSEVIGKIESV